MSYSLAFGDIDAMVTSLRRRVDELTGEGINYSNEVKDLRHQVQYANDRVRALLESNAQLRKSLERVRQHSMALAVELGQAKREELLDD